MIDPLELPVITESPPLPPLVSTEEALRRRIAKAAGTKTIPREAPQGEPFVWADPPREVGLERDMTLDIHTIIKQFVDLLMPDLSPHEASLYIFLFRLSHLEDGQPQIRIGQRTIAQMYGRGPKMATPSRTHILRQVKQLQQKGCSKVRDTNREGTLYEVILPASVPSVVEKLNISQQPVIQKDFYNDLSKRGEIYDRDHWICFYCGEPVTEDNVTLDHFDPVCKGGGNTKANLKTSCLICNSIKSGKTYDEAIPRLFKSVQERAKQRNQR